MPDTGKLSSEALAVTDYLVPFPTPYKRAVLNQNPINMQLMSILDTTINYGKHLSSFAKGGVSSLPALCSSLINYADNERVYLREFTKEIMEILGVLKLCNPIVRNFATMLERPNPTNGVPILTGAKVDTIIREIRAKDPRPYFQISSDDDAPPMHLGLAFEMHVGPTLVPPSYAPRAHESVDVGDVQGRGLEDMDIDLIGGNCNFWYLPSYTKVSI